MYLYTYIYIYIYDRERLPRDGFGSHKLGTHLHLLAQCRQATQHRAVEARVRASVALPGLLLRLNPGRKEAPGRQESIAIDIIYIYICICRH